MYTYSVVSVLIVYVSVTLLVASDSSQLKLESSPGVIHEIFSKKLQLRCTVENKKWRAKIKPTTDRYYSDILIVKPVRNDEAPEDLENTPEPKCATSQGKADFSQLLSLVVTKLNPDTDTNETVASVTGCEAPVIEKQFMNTVEVEGSAEGSPRNGEQGYLTLTWDRPGDSNAGYFSCEASALNTDKHSVSLKISLENETVVTTIHDLVTQVLLSEKYILNLRAKVNEIHKINNELKDKVQTLVSENKDLSTNINSVKGRIVKTGTSSCSISTVTFTPAFDSVPTVFVSLNVLSVNNINSGSFSYSLSAYSVTTSQFVVSCGISHYLSSATFSWIAIGS